MLFKQSPEMASRVAQDGQYSFTFTRFWNTWSGPREAVFQEMLSPFRDQPVKFLEIGSYEGASAMWMLQNILTHPEATMTCVDNNRLRMGRRLVKNLKRSGFDKKTTIHWVNSRDLREHVPDNHYDFVYVDGSHAAPNVLYDTVTAYLICKPGGLVGCDDYLFDRPEAGSVPKPAIDAFLAMMHDKVEIVHNDYQLWFRKK